MDAVGMPINNDLSNEISPDTPPNRSGEQAALTRLTWNTQVVSDLAGTTVCTLRYYHQIDLFRESKWTTKELLYNETHLLTLLRIKRLSMMSLILDEIVNIIHIPISPRARHILLELDQALAGRVAEIGSQRRVIEECLRDNTPVDILPRFARYLATLQRLGNYDTTAAGRMLEELATGYDSEEAAGVVDAVIQDPIISRLSVLEEGLRRINEDLGEPELADLAEDYGRLLADLHTVNTQVGLKSVSGHDLVEATGLAKSTADE